MTLKKNFFPAENSPLFSASFAENNLVFSARFAYNYPVFSAKKRK